MIKRNAYWENFIRHKPWLCHVSLAADIASIHKHGLLSTSALLDLFEVPETQRRKHELEPRKTSVPLSHPLHGTASLNDQAPLHLGGLERCLDGMNSVQWCKQLNSRVFFRPVKELSDCVWNTKLTTDRKKITLVAETRMFPDVYEGDLETTSINPRYTKREPARRGSYTFKPLRQLFEQDHCPVSAVSELSILHKVSRTDLFKEISPEAVEA